MHKNACFFSPGTVSHSSLRSVVKALSCRTDPGVGYDLSEPDQALSFTTRAFMLLHLFQESVIPSRNFLCRHFHAAL